MRPDPQSALQEVEHSQREEEVARTHANLLPARPNDVSNGCYIDKNIHQLQIS